jgi:hypothetical protein
MDIESGDVLEFDLVTGKMRTRRLEDVQREMNAPSDEPRVFKVVATDGLQTKDGAA